MQMNLCLQWWTSISVEAKQNKKRHKEGELQVWEVKCLDYVNVTSVDEGLQDP